MRNIRKIFLLFLISLLLFTLNVHGNNKKEIEYLIDTFNESELNLQSYWLHVGGTIGTYTDNSSLVDFGNNLSSSLMLPTVSELLINSDQIVYYTSGTWGNETEVELQIKKVGNKKDNLYLLFRLKGTKDIDKLTYYYDKLFLGLSNNQISPKINTCIQGNINDKLNSIEQIEYIEKILVTLDAKEVEKLNSQLVNSISAYTSRIDNYIWTGSKKMNLQVASHVNNLTERTIITMGTPIITIEY